MTKPDCLEYETPVPSTGMYLCDSNTKAINVVCESLVMDQFTNNFKYVMTVEQAVFLFYRSIAKNVKGLSVFCADVLLLCCYISAGDPKPKGDGAMLAGGFNSIKKPDISRPPVAVVTPMRNSDAPKSFISDTNVTIVNASNRPVTVVNTRNNSMVTATTPVRNGVLSQDGDVRESLDPCVDLCRYPPEGTKGSMIIKSSDLLTLDSDTFLNDTVIDFYMSYLKNAELPKDLSERVFVFNTFFYSTLNKSQAKNLTPEERKLPLTKRRHGNVKRWTKGVDLFSKDFIVIPICQNSHWFLVIVCYPWLVAKARGIDLSSPAKVEPDEVKKESSPMEDDVIAGAVVGTTKGLVAYEDSEDGEDAGDGTQAKEEEVPNSTLGPGGDTKGVTGAAAANNQEIAMANAAVVDNKLAATTPAKAAIYIFDSLRGSVSCSKVYQTVR